ncbi:hypothetical protein AAVH_20617 [Aphelenchoides avenae]|nr:hypothetical protein AAVH_20617 [Aphelenchus avenae]
MLPYESFVDVVSFLGYYDLGGLKLASKRLSAIARQCATAIRLFDFCDLTFHIHRSFIDVYRYDASVRRTHCITLELTSEKCLAEFIAEAFRNCTVRSLYVVGRCEHALNAVKAIASTIIVTDILDFFGEAFANVGELMEFVDSFPE